MRLETERLVIRPFTPDMAEAVHRNSLDEDNRRFVPDEVFETVEEAEETVRFLLSRYETADGPFVYSVLLKTGENIGYVQAVSVGDGWEIGYHIAKPYTGRGYAAEAVSAFLPWIAGRLQADRITGICLRENIASARVMEKCGFTPVFSGQGQYQGEIRDIIQMQWKRP